MKILKPPYETSFFSSIFLLRFFSNVNFARWNSPLTFYEILWITQTFFLKKVNKQMCFVLTTRLKTLSIKTMILSNLLKKMHLLMPKKQISIEFACWFFSALEVQKKNCRLNHEHGASLRSRFLLDWGFCKKAYKW